MTNKILCFSFYEPKEHIYQIIDCMETHQEVVVFPLYQYKYDPNDRVQNIQERIDKLYSDNQISFNMWFFLDQETIEYIVDKYKVPNIAVLYNSDISKKLIETLQNMSIVFTNDYLNTNRYRILLGHQNVYYFPTPYNEKLVIHNSTIEYNITIYLSSLKYLTKKIRNLIIQLHVYSIRQGYSIALYGPEELETFFPNIYLSELDEIDLSIAFSLSKICIYLDDCHDKDFLHNCVRIMALDKLLIVDSEPANQNIVEDMFSCLTIENNSLQTIVETVDRDDEIERILANAKSVILNWENTVRMFLQKVELFTGEIDSDNSGEANI